VLLGGDDNLVPMRYAWAQDDCDSVLAVIPTDLYFSDLTGLWQTDWDYCPEFGSYRWGEPEDDGLMDPFPEIFVGRILAKDVSEAENWVSKRLVYEKYPLNGPLLDHQLWLYVNEYEYDVEEIIVPEIPPSFTNVSGKEISSLDGSVAELLSEGYGWVNIYANSSHEMWISRSEGGTVHRVTSYPHPVYSDLDQLTNDGKYYIVYSISCMFGAFDDRYSANDTIIGAGFTSTYPERGGVAAVVPTRIGMWWYSTLMHRAFLRSLFRDFGSGRLNLSAALGRARLESIFFALAGVCQDWDPNPWYLRYSTTLLGCPRMTGWEREPKGFIVEHPGRVEVAGENDFLVTVFSSESEPVPGCRVCLWNEDDIYKVGTTGESGVAGFILHPVRSGLLHVTVTKKGFSPWVSESIIGPSIKPVTKVNVRIQGPQGDKGFANIYPEEFEVLSVSPNPVRSESSIRIALPSRGTIRLSVVDATGRTISEQFIRDLDPGYHSFGLDIKELGLRPGLYWLFLESNRNTVSHEIVVLSDGKVN
jgi:hypothetical protein